MAIATDSTAFDGMVDKETKTADVTYTFKTTEENKEKQISPAVSEEVKKNILDFQTRNARWRSLGQFVNDALIYYLNGNTSEHSVEEIEEEVERDYDYTLQTAVTETLFDEVTKQVDHPHTPWDFKQEFYSCAIYSYSQNGFPVVERR